MNLKTFLEEDPTIKGEIERLLGNRNIPMKDEESKELPKAEKEEEI